MILFGFRDAYTERNLLYDEIISSHPYLFFLSFCHYFTGPHEAILMSGNLCLLHLLQASIKTSGLWLIREKLKSMFILGKPSVLLS